jgi:hypothetical protein
MTTARHRRFPARARVLLPCLLGWALTLHAADDGALDIADRLGERAARPVRDWQLSVELGAGRDHAAPGSAATRLRGTVDLRIDTVPAPGWRVVFADQLDVDDPALPGRPNTVNSLKEAWVGWQPAPRLALELGRVNLRSDVALGYSPTDWFRAGALRGSTVVEPQRRRGARLGTVVARGQWLWDGGAASLVAAPKLADVPSDASFSADLGATNDRDRALLSLSQRLGPRWSQQAHLYAERGRPAQWGLGSSVLIGDALTAYLELAGGRDRSILSRATGGPDDTRARHRAAAGATYTTADKLSLSAEFQYSGAGVDEATWRALPATSPDAVPAVLGRAASTQDLPTRSAWFVHAAWQDWPHEDVDLTLLARFNRQDGSRLAWFEAKWHVADQVDVALQGLALSGRTASEYGSAPVRRSWMAVLKLWF